jgi:hypothetical protein
MSDPDIPDRKLNQVDPLFPDDYVPGELSGVTQRSSTIFQTWAGVNGDSCGEITTTAVTAATGTTYTLRWQPRDERAQRRGSDAAGQDAGPSTTPAP